MSIEVPIQYQSKVLTSVVEQLSIVTKIEEITQIVAEAARNLTGADGATFVLKDEQQCYYIDENAISPLWKGKRFPIETCISGWAMTHKEVVVVQDIYQDSRIPHDAYRPTFVKSLCLVPIRAEDPIGAIGNYWARDHIPTSENIKILQILANSAAVALQNLVLKQKLQKQDEEKQGFKNRAQELEAAICSVAHDLRSPLAAMMGLAELMSYHVQSSGDETMHTYAQTILATGRQASEQIAKMLSLYKVTRAQVDFKRLDMTSTAKSVMSHLMKQNPNQLIELQIGENLSAYGDESLVKIVLENLLSNALKYSSKKPKSYIEVGSLSDSGVMNTFYVKDNGDGFQPSKTDLLFRPLSRLHSDSDFQGTGLGLVSVARIVEMHGGTVKAEGHPNQGATFFFSLPQIKNN